MCICNAQKHANLSFQEETKDLYIRFHKETYDTSRTQFVQTRYFSGK